MIDFWQEKEYISDSEVKQLIDTIDKALAYLELPTEVDIDLGLVSNEKIKEINRQERGLDKVTDVLSFPMLDFNCPLDIEAFEEARKLMPDSAIFLGDIVLSFEKMQNQALEFGHSENRELIFLIVHSLLHLLGYDHMKKEEEERMNKKQKEIMNYLKIMK